MLIKNNHFGLIIWGVRNGFDKNILISDHIPEVLSVLTDEMRQICNETTEEFYSIEKTNNYTLVTIYNPDMRDHVGRKAYIAITLFIENKYCFDSNILPTLNELMQMYTIKQKASIVNMFTPEYFYSYLVFNAETKELITKTKETRFKLGFKKYNSTEEILSFFEDLAISGYRKIYFISKPNNTIENNSSYKEVFQNPIIISIEFPNYNSIYHKIYINDNPISKNSNIRTTIEVYENDIIKVINKESGREICHFPAKFDTRIPLDEPQKKPPIKPGKSLLVEGGKNPPPKKWVWQLLYTFLVAIVIVIAYEIFHTTKPPMPPTEMGKPKDSLAKKEPLDESISTKILSQIDSLNESGQSILNKDATSNKFNNKYIRIWKNQWQYNKNNDENLFENVTEKKDYNYLNIRFDKSLNLIEKKKDDSNKKKEGSSGGAKTKTDQCIDICNAIKEFKEKYENKFVYGDDVWKEMNRAFQKQKLESKYSTLTCEDPTCEKAYQKISGWQYKKK